MRSQVGTARLTVLITTSAPMAERGSHGHREVVRARRSAAREAQGTQLEAGGIEPRGIEPRGIEHRDKARPASTASAGASGSRYSKPFTGQRVKNNTGTMTQASSSGSRHVASRRSRI